MKGKKNIYDCECGKGFVTIDREAGVTPMMVLHRRFDPKATCKGICRSRFYTVDQSQKPSHEWYIPDATEAVAMGPEVLAHVQHGGLLVRPIKEIKEPYLLFSVKHSPAEAKALWWRPDSAGYTIDLDSAGRYEKADAEQIAAGSPGDTVAVPEQEALKLGLRMNTVDFAKARYRFIDKKKENTKK